MRQIPYLKSLFVSFSIVALAAFITTPAHAQSTTSSIRVEVTDETVEEVLSQCELKLSKLMSMAHLDGGKLGTRRQQKIDLAHYEERMMQKSQSDIRIRLNEQEDEELDDEEYDEDLDEDCLNRRHVKYNSEQIVEKQVKKMKKRQQTKKK